jgi:hypothetical protein
VLHALVLATQALIIFDRAKNFRAKQTFTLGLESAVINGLGFFNLAERPRTDHFWRSKADAKIIKFAVLILLLE